MRKAGFWMMVVFVSGATLSCHSNERAETIGPTKHDSGIVILSAPQPDLLGDTIWLRGVGFWMRAPIRWRLTTAAQIPPNKLAVCGSPTSEVLAVAHDALYQGTLVVFQRSETDFTRFTDSLKRSLPDPRDFAMWEERLNGLPVLQVVHLGKHAAVQRAFFRDAFHKPVEVVFMLPRQFVGAAQSPANGRMQIIGSSMSSLRMQN